MTTKMHGVKSFLTPLVARYHRSEYLSSDPLEIVHRFLNPRDQEVVALLCAVLAYGNVKQIKRSIEDALGRLAKRGSSPSWVIETAVDEELRSNLKSFIHRFNQGDDLWILFKLISLSWKKYGSVGSHLIHYLKPDDKDFGEALSQMFDDWKIWLKDFPVQSKTFSYLISSPRDGSCCKRWCMLLRWMGRKDHLDLGLWMEGSPLLKEGGIRSSQLVMPLDTHTGRISQYINLTGRKTLNWLAAVEITDRLREISPEDPTQYDFALSRLGILSLCQTKYRAEICTRCELVTVCKFAKRHQND